jgi:hypothetical protein
VQFVFWRKIILEARGNENRQVGDIGWKNIINSGKEIKVTGNEIGGCEDMERVTRSKEKKYERQNRPREGIPGQKGGFW